MRLRPLVLASFLAALAPVARGEEPAPPSAAVDADAALATLKAGNARFAAGESTFPHVDQARRCATTEGGQHPIASILACADSRVPPEFVFDEGLGDLFVIRVAGNVAAADEVGTLEYGAAHLGTPLIVVMGHAKCGAVTAVVKHSDVEPNIAHLVAPIGPAVEDARAEAPDATESKLVSLAIKANVRRAMHDVLAQSPTIRGLVASGKVKLVGAVYDIHSGAVDWIGEHPQQAALLGDASPAEAEPAAAEAHDEHAAAPKLAAHDLPAEHAAAVKPIESRVAAKHDAEPAEKPTAHGGATHAEAVAKPVAHGEAATHGEQASHGEPASKGKPDAHAKPDAGAAHDAAAMTNGGEESHASISPEQPSLVARQGLLVPAAFMAAGSALSGTIVYTLKSRRPAAAAVPADGHDAHGAHAAPEAATTPSGH